MTALRIVPAADVEAALGVSGSFDAVVFVAAPDVVADLDAHAPAGIASAAGGLLAVDDTARGRAATTRLIAAPELAGGRLVFATTGPVARDYDDVRRFADAAGSGLRRARDAGAVRPFLVVAAGAAGAQPEFAELARVTGLAALGALWEPLEAREARGDATCEPVESVGFAPSLDGDAPNGADIEAWITATDAGMRLAKDLGGTEPERMAPPRFAELCRDAFAGTDVAVEVVDDVDELLREYPLLMGVARASLGVERHRPAVIRLTYEGDGPIESTLLFAGKGLTYDTGGADIKAGGAMAGMSRDKCGGAAVAGFVRAVAGLRPKGVRVVAEIGAVRNSVGADAFVSDEILTSHAGTRVRIGNTDAEGRLVLADLLSHLREQAVDAPAPRMFSVATLTGHAARAVGPYTAVLDNGPAQALGTARAFADHGDVWGDPCDVSTLRREDYEFVRPRSRADDVLSCNNAPSSATPRGHQFPMAFLAIASGLDAHGREADKPLPYSHVDVAGSATLGDDWQHGNPTGRPIVAMLAALLES